MRKLSDGAKATFINNFKDILFDRILSGAGWRKESTKINRPRALANVRDNARHMWE